MPPVFSPSEWRTFGYRIGNDVIESALKTTSGRCIVNSVNLEKSGERVKKVLPLVKRYGAAVVCGDDAGVQEAVLLRQVAAMGYRGVEFADFGGVSGKLPPQLGRRLYERVLATARASHPQVACGEFGADMQVHLVNDGPVTISLRLSPRTDRQP